MNKVKQLLGYNELIKNLVLRDLRVKYKRSLLGFMWTLIEPLLMMVVFYIIFSQIIKIEVDNFPLFLLCGILSWNFLANSLHESTDCILINANLIKKVYFPKEILPISIILSNLIHFLLALIVLFVFIFILKLGLHPALLFLPIIIFFQIIFSLGLSFLFACGNVYFRDTKYILGIILLAWFYASGIFYPESMVPERFRDFFMLNPMASFITFYRNILLDGQLPQLKYIIITGLISILTFGICYYVFNRFSKHFAEVS